MGYFFTEYLNKHAYHKIQIGTEAESVEINLKILGHKPYMEGIAKLIDYLSINEIKCKKYHIIEFVENGFI